MVQEQSKIKRLKNRNEIVIFICGQSNSVQKDFPRKLKKVTGDKIYIHKSVVFLYANSKFSKK